MGDNDKSFAKKWRQLSGQDEWYGMLEPLDIDLRRYLIHYGHMAQATYNAFNSEPKSKYAGSSYYSRSDFFSKVGYEIANPYKYKVTKFIYATSSLGLPDAWLFKSLSRESWSEESNWIGYIAVATDEGKKVLGRRDIVVAWRGTIQPLEWGNDLQFLQVPADQIFGPGSNVKVHQGWLSLYASDDPHSRYNKQSARDQVFGELKRLVEKYKHEETTITVTGHSLGAAVATLNAVDIVANAVHKPKGKPDNDSSVTAFVFASPRVGDFNFLDFFSGLNDLRVLRLHNIPDVVPTWPPLGYSEVGQELLMDTRKSQYLNILGDFKTWHNLQVYMHGVAGTQGLTGGFKLEIDLDLALLNTDANELKDEYLVPAQWRIQKNNGMVQVADGTWKLMDSQGDINIDL